MEFRDYLPGDDLRHVDWRAFARTDQMKVRLYREEVVPILDIVVDTSRSMGVTELKERAARDICDALHEWIRVSAGGRGARFFASGGGVVEPDRLAFDADAREVTPRVPLRARSLRLVLSDFLSPADPAPVLRRLAAGASHLYVVQLLDPWEVDPARDGARTLIDAECGERLELVLDEPSVAAYRERLGRLRASVERAVRSLGGTFAGVVADEPSAMFRRDLLVQGVVEPR
jgi:uncharacterized protein (DUF58 family)